MEKEKEDTEVSLIETETGDKLPQITASIGNENADTAETSKDEVNVPNKSTFKKPVLIGKIGRLPRKIGPMKIPTVIDKPECKDVDPKNNDLINKSSELNAKQFKPPAQQLVENSIALPYKEPKWSGLPQSSGKDYGFDVLKSGVILEHINLMSKPFWVFGRSTNCEIYMAHPTVSRYHAVLQYRNEGTDENPRGFYIYDLSSTHGTFLNKGELKPRVYAPLRVGHIIKLGCSTRSYVLTGPEEDSEAESELSLTELKKQRAEKLLQRELELKQFELDIQREKEEQEKRFEERGVDWGLGEDADEESDITENPFAQTNNEELYIDDPKKALRGFMEREGYSLEYDCTEQGFGQFLCKVELPLDDDAGERIVAEVIHKGKKKEAVIQCALEACRILDRHGVLRQATHESRKRKGRNWEENDYYDSDDDTYLDRTGSIEKKREKRMHSKIPQQPETYQSLVEKEKKISSEISKIENQLMLARKGTEISEAPDEDSLDLFMKGLKDSKPDKQTISKLKSDLISLKAEHINIMKLVNLAKPVDLPPLVVSNTNLTEKVGSATSKLKLPIFGKRKKYAVCLPQKDIASHNDSALDDVEEEEGDETETQNNSDENNIKEMRFAESIVINPGKKLFLRILQLQNVINSKECPLYVRDFIAKVQKILLEIKALVEGDEKLNVEKNNQKSNDDVTDDDEIYLLRICKELEKLCSDVQNIAEIRHKCNSFLIKLRELIKAIKDQVFQQQKLRKLNNKQLSDLELEENEDNAKVLTVEAYEKRKKKNQKRNMYRKEKSEIEKQKGYQEDAQKEDYNMWVPPENQTGDGRTTLNEKFGY